MGSIYRLRCPDGRFYYGSTEAPLAERLRFHKWASTQSTSPLYRHVAATGGWDAITIELVATVDTDLKQTENEYIRQGRQDSLCLNRNMAIRTPEEKKAQDRVYNATHREAKREAYNRWREQNRDRMREHQKKWRDANKEHIAEYGRSYREAKTSLG